MKNDYKFPEQLALEKTRNQTSRIILIYFYFMGGGSPFLILVNVEEEIL